ncbi:MAG: hypothetical protein AAGG01_17960 [Planctomycetota bacterium]
MKGALSAGVRSAFVGQGLQSGGSFVATMLLLRVLGLGAFGELGLLLILAGYGAGLVQALVAQPLLSLGPLVSREERLGYVRDAFAMGAFLAIALGVCAGAGVAALAASGRDVTMAAPAAGGLVALRSCQPAIRAALHTLERTRWTPAYDAMAPWCACALLLGGVVPDGDVGRALTILSASAALAVLFGAAGLWSLGLRFLPSTESLRRHWDSGRWLAGTQALSWVGTGSLHATTAVVLGAAGVGAIRAAQSVVGAVLVVAQALELALPSKAAAAFQRGGEVELDHWCRTTARACAGVFLAVGSVLIWVAPPCIERWMGASSEMASEAFLGLAWLPVATVVGIVVQVRLRVTRQTRGIFAAYAASSVMSAALAVPLVAKLGVLGAALGLTAGQVLFTVLLLAARRLPFHLRAVITTHPRA